MGVAGLPTYDAGSTVSYEYVAYLKNVFDQHRVQKIAFDRWNMAHLKAWLLNAGFSEQVIAEKFVAFAVDVACTARP